MCPSLESAYQALYTELLVKSRHNDIPSSPVARARLRALIDQTRSDLQTCSESATRSQILRVLELQESLLAPIRTLSSDVLIDIFQLVIETSGKPGITYPYRDFKLTSTPNLLSGCIFLLTWICFWWRDEALSYSAFWSTIAFDCTSPSQSDALPSAAVTAFMNECISRSGVSVPMSVTISMSLLRDESTPAVVTMLVAQAHRWRQAALSSYFPHNIDIMFPFKFPSTHLPLLEDLSILCRSGASTDPTQHPILECHLPLQKLELSVLLESYADVIASRNLKVLKLDHYYGVSLARLLHICPCLESLTLGSFCFKGNPDVEQITCQSSLLNLKIGWTGYTDIGAWNCVTVPKLARLDVTLPGLVDYDLWEAASEADISLGELKEVIKRSECTLQRVNLITRAEEYRAYRGSWPESVLEKMEQLFEDLSVKAEGCFVENLPLHDWKDSVWVYQDY